jgi:hypothetical protein
VYDLWPARHRRTGRRGAGLNAARDASAATATNRSQSRSRSNWQSRLCKGGLVFFKERLSSGDLLRGVAHVIPSAVATQAVAAAGVDFVMIDREHGPIGRENLHAMVASTAGTDCAPLVRVPTRREVAMTGEITLRGKVLPIGGVKEKVLAARAAKINTIILPKLNERDMVDVPEPIKRDMQFYFVEHVEEVLKIALLERSAAEQKTTERAGRESKPLPEPEPAPATEEVPVAQAG